MNDMIAAVNQTILDAIYEGKDFQGLLDLLEEKYDIDRLIRSYDGGQLLTKLYDYYHNSETDRHPASGTFVDTLFLRQILFGSHEDDTLSGRILASGLKSSFIEDSAACMVAALPADNGHLPRAAENMLSADVPGAMHTVREDIAYILLSRINTDTSAEYEISVLSKMAEQFGFRIGVSSVYHDLDSSSYYRRQATETMKIAIRTDTPVLRAEDVYGDVLLGAALHDFSTSIFQLAEKKRLTECDRVNGTDYERTLRVYLENSCRQAQTAQTLFIDRSTLKYRLKKITELLGAEPDKMSPGDRLRLLTCLKING